MKFVATAIDITTHATAGENRCPSSRAPAVAFVMDIVALLNKAPGILVFALILLHYKNYLLFETFFCR
jgi:hypothetical protein